VWSLAARAPQPAMPLIGFLSSVSASVTSKRISSFGQGLSDTGYLSAETSPSRRAWRKAKMIDCPPLAADLVSGHARLIAASGPPRPSQKRAATSLPIVFVAAFDPVQAGLVATLNQPGGNVTGVTLVGARLGGQRLELVRELVPNVGVIAVITNPNSTDASEELRDVQNAARAAGQELVVVAATSDRDYEAAFAVIVQRRAQVLLISTDPFLAQSADRIIALAAQHRIPAVYATSAVYRRAALMRAAVPSATSAETCRHREGQCSSSHLRRCCHQNQPSLARAERLSHPNWSEDRRRNRRAANPVRPDRGWPLR
jgi:putative ABC transport system substrate-binding protein